MSCTLCQNFPCPPGKFEELAISIERHGTLYRCDGCGGFFELIAEERNVRFLSQVQAENLYPKCVSKTGRTNSRDAAPR